MGIVLGKISVEVPVHTVISTKEGYELRRYSPQLIATYTSTSTSTDNNFRALAGYCGIFTKPKQVEDSSKKAMAMTAPVLMEGMTLTSSGEKKVDSMSFFLPAAIKTLEEAPKPLDSNIAVSLLPERVMAVLTFSGSLDAKVFQDKVDLLKSYLERDGVESKGKTPVGAGYNPPFCVPFLRTNEVLIEVEDKVETLPQVVDPSDEVTSVA